jgi:hypothetical protein
MLGDYIEQNCNVTKTRGPLGGGCHFFCGIWRIGDLRDLELVPLFLNQDVPRRRLQAN